MSLAAVAENFPFPEQTSSIQLESLAESTKAGPPLSPTRLNESKIKLPFYL